KVFWPQAASTVVFVIMAVILVLRPQGLFGRETTVHAVADVSSGRSESWLEKGPLWFGILLGIGLVLPYLLFPIFAMKILCLALFALAYNIVFGYGGLLAFGHAAFYGSSSYVAAHAAAV